MGYKWSDADVALLRAEYETSTNSRLRELFPNRTDLAIYKKARKLGYYKTQEIAFQNASLARKGYHGKDWNGTKKSSAGYIMIFNPSHARADKSGYVLEHIVVFENETGITVPDGCVIHHINGNKSDNRIENLCMMTKAAHIKLHHTGEKRSLETRNKISEAARIRFSDKRNHPSYKDIDIEEIVRLKREGVMVKDIAKQFGINRTTVWSKMKGENNG